MGFSIKYQLIPGFNCIIEKVLWLLLIAVMHCVQQQFSENNSLEYARLFHTQHNCLVIFKNKIERVCCIPFRLNEWQFTYVNYHLSYFQNKPILLRSKTKDHYNIFDLINVIIAQKIVNKSFFFFFFFFQFTFQIRKSQWKSNCQKT